MPADDFNLNDIVIDWLAKRGPDDWHRFAQGWNWDHGLEPLDWIARQPQCDKATALQIFWLSAPDTVIECATIDIAAERSVDREWPVLKAIAERWFVGGFIRSEIAYNEPEQWSLSDWRALEARLQGPQPFVVADDMMKPRTGRKLSSFEDIYDGIPSEIARKIPQD